MRIFNWILDEIFPTKCAICGKIGESICTNCAKKIDKYKIENQSGMQVEKIAKNLTSLFVYDGEIRELLLQYKFRDKSYLYKFFANRLINDKKVCKIINNCDIIIPVPVHRKRKAERGYNQSELIIEEVCKKMYNSDEKVRTDIIKKTKNIKPQSTKGYSERMKDVKGVYELIKPEAIHNKKVLIFDDIYTTGSTLNECAQTLAPAIPTSITFLTVSEEFLKED